MKKTLVIILLFIFMCGGCSCISKTDVIKIPSKQNSNDNATFQSPINAHNLDKYLFRDDVQYVDLREMSFVINSGYIAGFQFIPYHSIIASFYDEDTLYKMVNKTDDNGNLISAGTIGGFQAQYRESQRLIKTLFDENKYIFFVSQAGSEGSYMINLLIQLGYDGNKLYNICGVVGTEGVPSYVKEGNKKYFIKGNTIINTNDDFEFKSTLTPIN